MRALIVGGGVAGPALALLLKRASLGIEPVLFEAAGQIRDVGAGLCLTPNGLRVLDALGLTRQIMSAGHVVDKLQLCRPDGRIIVSAPFAPGQRLPVVTIRRHALQTLLHHHLHREGIRVEYGKRLFSVAEGGGPGGGEVFATFQDGSTAEGAMLFGCDGIRSQTRQQLFGQDSPTHGGEVVYMALTSSALPNLPDATCRMFMGPHKHLGAYHVSDDVSMWWALTQQAEATWDTSMDLPIWGPLSRPDAVQEQLLIMFDDMPGVHDIISHDLDRMVMLDLYARPLRSVLFQSRIALLGDAANPVNPHLGQGANKALEDAGVLVECLKQFHTNMERALGKYQKIRSHRAGEIQRWSGSAGAIRNISNTLAVTLRDTALKVMLGLGGKMPGSWLYAYDYRKAATL